MEKRLLSQQEAQLALDRAKPFVKKNGKVVAVCGPSSGKALWLQSPENGKAELSDDRIDNGRLVFIENEDGPNVVTRDAGSDYSDAKSESGDVRVIHSQRSPASTWIVTYPSTGVAQTHNLTFNKNGQLVDMWTANKPEMMNAAHTFLFTANCVQP